jgi:hypothetical protein
MAAETIRYMTPEDAADYLSVTPRALRDWRRRGCGPRYSRLGGHHLGRVRYEMAELHRWMAAQTVGSTAEEVGPDGANGAARTGRRGPTGSMITRSGRHLANLSAQLTRDEPPRLSLERRWLSRAWRAASVRTTQPADPGADPNTTPGRP